MKYLDLFANRSLTWKVDFYMTGCLLMDDEKEWL